jgi:hypothetical protein
MWDPKVSDRVTRRRRRSRGCGRIWSYERGVGAAEDSETACGASAITHPRLTTVIREPASAFLTDARPVPHPMKTTTGREECDASVGQEEPFWIPLNQRMNGSRRSGRSRFEEKVPAPQIRRQESADLRCSCAIQ